MYRGHSPGKPVLFQFRKRRGVPPSRHASSTPCSVQVTRTCPLPLTVAEAAARSPQGRLSLPSSRSQATSRPRRSSASAPAGTIRATTVPSAPNHACAASQPRGGASVRPVRRPSSVRHTSTPSRGTAARTRAPSPSKRRSCTPRRLSSTSATLRRGTSFRARGSGPVVSRTPSETRPQSFARATTLPSGETAIRSLSLSLVRDQGFSRFSTSRSTPTNAPFLSSAYNCPPFSVSATSSTSSRFSTAIRSTSRSRRYCASSADRASGRASVRYAAAVNSEEVTSDTSSYVAACWASRSDASRRCSSSRFRYSTDTTEAATTARTVTVTPRYRSHRLRRSDLDASRLLRSRRAVPAAMNSRSSSVSSSPRSASQRSAAASAGSSSRAPSGRPSRHQRARS